jgi:predicted DNA-binding transcriptional regulator AlpA
MSEALWNKRETANFLGISVKTLNRWITERKGPQGRRVVGVVRWIPSEVREFVTSCQPAGSAKEVRLVEGDGAAIAETQP